MPPQKNPANQPVRTQLVRVNQNKGRRGKQPGDSAEKNPKNCKYGFEIVQCKKCKPYPGSGKLGPQLAGREKELYDEVKGTENEISMAEARRRAAEEKRGDKNRNKPLNKTMREVYEELPARVKAKITENRTNRLQRQARGEEIIDGRTKRARALLRRMNVQTPSTSGAASSSASPPPNVNQASMEQFEKKKIQDITMDDALSYYKMLRTRLSRGNQNYSDNVFQSEAYLKGRGLDFLLLYIIHSIEFGIPPRVNANIRMEPPIVIYLSELENNIRTGISLKVLTVNEILKQIPKPNATVNKFYQDVRKRLLEDYPPRVQTSGADSSRPSRRTPPAPADRVQPPPDMRNEPPPFEPPPQMEEAPEPAPQAQSTPPSNSLYTAPTNTLTKAQASSIYLNNMKILTENNSNKNYSNFLLEVVKKTNANPIEYILKYAIFLIKYRMIANYYAHLANEDTKEFVKDKLKLIGQYLQKGDQSINQIVNLLPDPNQAYKDYVKNATQYFKQSFPTSSGTSTPAPTPPPPTTILLPKPQNTRVTTRGQAAKEKKAKEEQEKADEQLARSMAGVGARTRAQMKRSGDQGQAPNPPTKRSRR